MTDNLLAVRDLSVQFTLPDDRMTAVDRVSFSGSGKSQILFAW